MTLKIRHALLPLIAFASLSTGCIFVADEPEGDEPVVVEKPAVNEATLIGITPHSDFATTGLVEIAILPKDANGEGLIDASLDIELSVQGDNLTVSTEDVTEKEPQPDKELSAVLNLDSSGSMSGNDPSELRKDAAKQFVEALGENDAVAVCDFGAGSSDTFAETRLLSDFTVDRTQAGEAIDLATAQGGTPMFVSVVEVLDFYSVAYPEGDGNRSLLVLGDGQPNGDGSLEDACAKAQDTGIPINTIGFGPAADQSPNVSEQAVKTLRDLASCSGGAYSGVVDADELGDAFTSFGEAARSGSVTITVRFDPIPESGSTVEGSLFVGNGTQTPVELSYDFVAP